MNIRKPVVASTEQKGYVSIIILAIIAVTGYLILTKEFAPGKGGFCPQKTTEEEKDKSKISLPAINITGQGTDPSRGNREYVLVRKDIKLARFEPRYGDYLEVHTVAYRNVLANDGNTYEVRYPMHFGEVDTPVPVNNRSRPDLKDVLIVRDFGMVYFFHLGSDGKPLIQTVKDDLGKDVEYYLVDFYQDTTEQPIPDEILCSQARNTFITPSQSPSKNRTQLQLEWFLFKTYNVFPFHCKPAIYLYPKEKTEVSVEVFPKGHFTYTDPKYPEGGWKVVADSSGKISAYGKEYDYLYYEARIHDSEIQKPKEGFVVPYEQLSTFYDAVLPQLGLNEKESADFKDYWLKTLPKSPYYFVGIISQSNLDYIEPLKISPKPDSILRVSLYFEALVNKKNAAPPIFSSFDRNALPAGRQGFTVVEWGGMVKTDKDHPFTCSQ